MPGSTTKGAPYPVGTDAAASLDTIVQSLAEWVDSRPGVASVTTAERDALAGANLWAGRVVFNNQTLRLQMYTGSAWTDDVVAVGTNALTDLAVVTAKLANLAVTTGKLADAAVTNPKLASGIAADKLTVGTLPADRLGNNSILEPKLANGSVTPAKMALTTTDVLVAGTTGGEVRLELARFGTGSTAIVFATITSENITGPMPAGWIPSGWRPNSNVSIYGLGYVSGAMYRTGTVVTTTGGGSMPPLSILSGQWVGANP